MSLTLTQARRMVAKSRRRLYREARAIVAPATFAAWMRYPLDDPILGRAYTPNERAWLVCGRWLPGFCRTKAQRDRLLAALEEFTARRLAQTRIEAARSEVAWARYRALRRQSEEAWVRQVAQENTADA